MSTVIARAPAHGVIIPDVVVSPRSLGELNELREVVADQACTQTVVRYGAQLNSQPEPLLVMLTQP